jgi:glycosyltransferase involved in cell wall biosynthesis
MDLYREVKRLRDDVGVTVVLRRDGRGEDVRKLREAQGQGDYLDVVDREWDGKVESGIELLDLGVFHVFSGYQACRAVRELMVEAKRRALRVVEYDEAPCEMCLGVKGALKRLYYAMILPMRVRRAVKAADLFISASGNMGMDRLVRLGWKREAIVPFGYACGGLGVRVSAPCGCSQPIGTRASRATARPSQELGVRGKGSEKRVLFVSRMHPKKGVLELVEAWGRLVDSRQSLVVSDWKVELVYTVNGDFEREYEAKVKAKVKELGLEDAFIFTGALDDVAKWEAYRRADLFVLPTYSENFGIVVAEALWAGVPVITTKGTSWSDLEGDTNLTTNDSQLTTRCGWWIDLPAEGSNSSTWDALDEALVSAMSMSDKERGEMGERGRKLVEEKYTWESVCGAMVKGYKEVSK